MLKRTTRSTAVARSTQIAGPRSRPGSKCMAPIMRRKRDTTTSCAPPLTNFTITGSSSALHRVVAVTASTALDSCSTKDDLRKTCAASGCEKKPHTSAMRLLFSSRGFAECTRKTSPAMPTKCIVNILSKFPLKVKKRVTVGWESTLRGEAQRICC